MTDLWSGFLIPAGGLLAVCLAAVIGYVFSDMDNKAWIWKMLTRKNIWVWERLSGVQMYAMMVDMGTESIGITLNRVFRFLKKDEYGQPLYWLGKHNVPHLRYNEDFIAPIPQVSSLSTETVWVCADCKKAGKNYVITPESQTTYSCPNCGKVYDKKTKVCQDCDENITKKSVTVCPQCKGENIKLEHPLLPVNPSGAFPIVKQGQTLSLRKMYTLMTERARLEIESWLHKYITWILIVAVISLILGAVAVYMSVQTQSHLGNLETLMENSTIIKQVAMNATNMTNITG